MSKLDIEFREQAALAGLNKDRDPARWKAALEWFQAGALAAMVVNSRVTQVLKEQAPRPNPKQPTMCGHCDYDEAEGFLIAQCRACRATDDRATIKLRGVPLRLYR